MNGPQPQGTVVAIIRGDSGTHAVVDVDAGISCPRCSAGRGCGAGLFAGRRAQRVKTRIAPGLDLVEGDVVRVELAPRDVLLAALIVYGLPLAGAASGALAAFLAGLGDAGAAVFAIGGLLTGVVIGRRRLARRRCLARFTPTASTRIATRA